MTGLLFSSRGTRQAMAVWAQDKLEAAHCERDVSSGVSKIGVLTNSRGCLIVSRVSNPVSRLC